MRCLETQYFIVELVGMRHTYHQTGMVYEDDERSTFDITPINTTPGPRNIHEFQLEANEIVRLFRTSSASSRVVRGWKFSIAAVEKHTCLRVRRTSPFATSIRH